jgi:hypothetical protein
MAKTGYVVRKRSEPPRSLAPSGFQRLSNVNGTGHSGCNLSCLAIVCTVYSAVTVVE